MTFPVIGSKGHFNAESQVELNLEGKNALVLGGSRGVGREIALALAREGVKVGVVARNQLEIENVVAAMGGERCGQWGIARDLVPEDAPRDLVAAINSMNKTVDIVVHNLGGTLDVKDPFCSISEWRRVWRLNFEIAVEINALLIPEMQKRKWGRIIHISSIAAEMSRGALPYCSAKAALNAYSRNLGCTVAPDNVIVTSIMPGAIAYEGSVWGERIRTNPDIVQDFLKNRIAINRFASPEDISEFVVFLASERASYFAGSLFPLDGGSW